MARDEEPPQDINHLSDGGQNQVMKTNFLDAIVAQIIRPPVGEIVHELIVNAHILQMPGTPDRRPAEAMNLGTVTANLNIANTPPHRPPNLTTKNP